MVQSSSNQGSSKPEVKGDLKYDSKVIQKIVGIALSDIKGLLTVNGGFFSNIADKIVNSDDVTSGVNVEVGKKQVAVDIEIVAEYGVDITKLYDQIKQKIQEKVKEMTVSLELLRILRIKLPIKKTRFKIKPKKRKRNLKNLELNSIFNLNRQIYVADSRKRS